MFNKSQQALKAEHTAPTLLRKMTNECAPRNLAKMTNLFQVAPDVAPEKTRNQAKDICRPYPIFHMQLSFFPDSISLVLFQLVCRPCSNQLKA
jgi:hypothetical protein